MSTQRLLRRIELAEKTAKAQSVFATHCICFPEDEQPEFRWRAEAEMAAEVLCPIHGIRFRIVVTRFLYRASWRYIQDFSQGRWKRTDSSGWHEIIDRGTSAGLQPHGEQSEWQYEVSLNESKEQSRL